MPHHLDPLLADHCPLLARTNREECVQVVALYNDVVQCYQLLLARCPPRFGEDKIKPAQSDLKRIHERLVRDRYQVGFLGPFQGGKSTTFNNILKVSKPEDAPATSGSGNATTAVVTRLIAGRGPHSIRLQYLLKEEFIARRQDMCVAIGLPPTVEDLELLQLVEEQIRLADASLNKDRGSALRQLKRFLNSYALFSAKVRDNGQRLEEVVAWDQRGQVLNHPPPNAQLTPAHTTLLESARIEYRTEAIPPELEIVDLPGLGGVNPFDDKLTQRYIERLDGAFVFSRADSIEDAHVSGFFLKLREHWNSLAGRAWLCYTKTDILVERHFADGYFDKVITFVRERGLPPGQVCWLCNAPEKLSDRFRQQDSLLTPALAPLAKAWSELYLGGGIPHLSRSILEEVPRRVGAGIVAEAKRALRRLGLELTGLAKSELGATDQDHEQLSHARRCLNEVSNIAVGVARNPGWFSDGADDLQKDLNEAYKALHIVPHVLDLLGNLRGKFRQHAGTLEAALHRRVRQDLVRRAYQDVLAQLNALEQAQRMRLPGVAEEGLAVAWEEFRAADEGRADWRGEDFPSFLHNDPFRGLDEAENPFNGQEYEDLFIEKIRVVTRQVVQKLRSRLGQRLRGLMVNLDEFASREYNGAPGPRDEEFEQLLNDYCQRFQE